MDSLLEPRLLAFLIILFALFQIFVLYRVLKMTDDVTEIKKYLKEILNQKKKETNENQP